MTREEAIAYGNRVIKLGLNDETQAFCEMAIKALEQEPCVDAISIQAVLDEISKSVDHSLYAYKSLMECVKTLPSVNPQEPKSDVLDKIRAEIDVARYVDKDTRLCKNANASGLEVAMQIIDKYKAESEG